MGVWVLAKPKGLQASRAFKVKTLRERCVSAVCRAYAVAFEIDPSSSCNYTVTYAWSYLQSYLQS